MSATQVDPVPSIEICVPKPNAVVGRTFPANGVWSLVLSDSEMCPPPPSVQYQICALTVPPDPTKWQPCQTDPGTWKVCAKAEANQTGLQRFFVGLFLDGKLQPTTHVHICIQASQDSD
jgi:hypothetical protein